MLSPLALPLLIIANGKVTSDSASAVTRPVCEKVLESVSGLSFSCHGIDLVTSSTLFVNRVNLATVNNFGCDNDAHELSIDY